MNWDLTFDNKNEREGLLVCGATQAVFILIHKGYLTFAEASECFEKPEMQLRRMFREWAKYNIPPCEDSLQE